jgi:ribosomal protein S18 acetylase RimI-like enzyme
MISIRRGVERPALKMEALEEIFFLTAAKQHFTSSSERKKYFATWLGDYLTNAPEQFYQAIGLHGELVGYLAGAIHNTQMAKPVSLLPYYDEISPVLSSFPAHFHLNIHPSFQQSGVGSALFNAFLNDLLQSKVEGVHVVTSKNAANLQFYSKIGLIECRPLKWGGGDVILLGRDLR